MGLRGPISRDTRVHVSLERKGQRLNNKQLYSVWASSRFCRRFHRPKPWLPLISGSEFIVPHAPAGALSPSVGLSAQLFSS